MKETVYSFAAVEDMQVLKDLLQKHQLPYEDVDQPVKYFIVAKEHSEMIACVGLECMGRHALLRSLVVREESRNRAIAKELIRRIEKYAEERSVEFLYLLTTTAEGYFFKAGFSAVEKNSLPDAIKNTREFSSLCPSSAICMYKKLHR